MNAGPILIAGAGGFVGAHIARELASRALPVIALARTTPARLQSTRGVKTITTDITSFDDVTRLMNAERPAIVINAAAYGVSPDETDERRMLAVNFDSAYFLAHSARAVGAKRFIQLGSYFEYGDQAETLHEETPCAPKTVYAATKAAASALLSAPIVTAPMETLVLRLFNVWGPLEHPHRLIPSVIGHCRAGTPLELTSGTQLKDYIFAPDLARWIADIAVSEQSYTHTLVNLPSSNIMAVKELALACARALNGEHLLRFGAKTFPGGEPQTPTADTARRDALLPVRTTTPLDAALAATIAAFEETQAS